MLAPKLQQKTKGTASQIELPAPSAARHPNVDNPAKLAIAVSRVRQAPPESAIQPQNAVMAIQLNSRWPEISATRTGTAQAVAARSPAARLSASLFKGTAR